MTARVRRLVLAATALVVALLTLTPAVAGASAPILGGGSGFAALEIDQWRGDTAPSPYNLNINYVAQGSTFGRQQFAQGTFDFGASDIEYIDEEKAALQGNRCHGRPLQQCFVYVPVSAGGLALMYNLSDNSGHRITDLRLTRRAACGIFTGAITKWNDPQIVATNPRLAAANRDIKAIIRADGAGESYVFSEFCIAVAPDIWTAFINQQRGNGAITGDSPEFAAGRPTSVWPPMGWGASTTAIPYADGTADNVANAANPNSITYVAAGYALVRNFPTASLQNAAGAFTQPDEANVTVALGYALPRGNGTFQLQFNGGDPRSYFPSTYSYILAQTAGFDASKGHTLGTFLCYAISIGQVIAPQLRYARLSSALVNIAEDAIAQIPGAPPKSSCFLAGAPPPPPPPSCAGCVAIGSNGRAVGGTGKTNTTGPSATTTASECAATDSCASSANGRVAGGSSSGEASIDAELANAAATASPSSHGSSSLWFAVIGVLAMWFVSTAWSRRKAAS